MNIRDSWVSNAREVLNLEVFTHFPNQTVNFKLHLYPFLEKKKKPTKILLHLLCLYNLESQGRKLTELPPASSEIFTTAYNKGN